MSMFDSGHGINLPHIVPQTGELVDLESIAQVADADTLTFAFQQRIIVQATVPVGTELTLGRFSTLEPGQLDLTPYEGVSLGTSREHARIRHDDDGWWIGDLDSSNGTWLNRQRLKAFHGYRLQIRNQVLLGNLLFYVVLPHKLFSGVAIPVNTAPARPLHVVHVEDDAGIQGVLKLSFEQAEPTINLRQYSRGEEALSYIERHSQDIDLFILDVRLPGKLSGIDLAHKIRLMGCPGYIILSSANWEPGPDILTTLRCEYLPKPRHILDVVPRLNHYRVPDTSKTPIQPPTRGDVRRTQHLAAVKAEQLSENEGVPEAVPIPLATRVLGPGPARVDEPMPTVPQPIQPVGKSSQGKSLVERLIGRLKGM